MRHIAVEFVLSSNGTQGRLPTFYWLAKLNKTYKIRIIVNSSSGSTAKTSKLSKSCLAAAMNHAVKYNSL